MTECIVNLYFFAFKRSRAYPTAPYSTSTKSFSIGDENESSSSDGSETEDEDLEMEEDELKGLKDDLDGSVLSHFVEENHPLLQLFL